GGTGAERPLRDPLVDDAGDEPHDARVEVREVGGGRGARRVVDEREDEADELLPLPGEREVVARDRLQALPRRARRLDLADEPLLVLLERALHERPIDALLAPIEMIEGRLGDLRSLADLPYRSGVVPLGREQL